MIYFEDVDDRVVLEYHPEQGDVSWLDHKLSSSGEHRLSWTFTLRRQDLIPAEDDDDSDVRRFTIGAVDGSFRRIRADVLGTKSDVLIDLSVPLSREVFVAQRNISIFGRIDDLISEPVVIGEGSEAAIPVAVFHQLLADFPTTSEMRLYSWARVTRVLREYLATMTDAEVKLDKYMNKRRRLNKTEPTQAKGRLPAANRLEIEKFTFVRDRIKEMLADAEAYSESVWQTTVADLFLLIFPQYVAVLDKVRIREGYSNAPKSTVRELDLLLVAANGSVDVLEIKKPFANSLMSVRQYRDNHVPMRELSGTIMQVEKYLFYLNKSGIAGEKGIEDKYRTSLPSGVQIRITSPKGFILAGRDDNFVGRQSADFEFVRRKYSNVVDIITYDDLLRRLEHILTALQDRLENVS